MSGFGLVELGAEGNLLPLSFLFPRKFQTVVLDVGLGHLHQQHVSGDASVVPPVENQRRHVFSVAFVVNLHDDRIFALHQQVADVHIERRETSHVVTGFLAVHPHATVVVRGTEIE